MSVGVVMYALVLVVGTPVLFWRAWPVLCSWFAAYRAAFGDVLRALVDAFKS